MAFDRSTAAARAGLHAAGHILDCVYGERTAHGGVAVGERRPRTMEAAYAALPPRARALMARRRA